MTPLHDNGADWTAADDNAVAAREAAKLRVFDAAHQADEPHWQDDDAQRAAKGFAAGFGLSLPFWIIAAALMWWGL